jgi:aminoglycoside phosphotransferase (APT) family kinase protein
MKPDRRPPPTLASQAQAWTASRYGPGASIADLEVMPGHAGLTYAFTVISPHGAVLDELVLRLPPKGVKLEGNTDVLRQAPLLEALAAAGVPVASVRAASADERWFGVPYLVVSRVAGRTVSIDVGGEPPRRAHFLRAAEALGELHRVPWQTLAGWSRPRGYGDEIRSWDRALGKAEGEPWHRAATRVREALVETEPAEPRIGVLHGDYQFSNLLFQGDDLAAIVDWEISGIGPQLLDLGWLLVINDQRSWAHEVAVGARPTDRELQPVYAAALGAEVDPAELTFACALAAYRFAVIAGLNLSLHRSGRRVDDHWELLASSIAVLLERAGGDLATASAPP